MSPLINRYPAQPGDPKYVVGQVGEKNSIMIAEESEAIPEELQDVIKAVSGNEQPGIKIIEDIQPKSDKFESSSTNTDWTVKGIQICMGIIGGGAAVISMYYTSIWIFQILPVFFGFILAFIMVGFSIMAFEVVILFLSGRFKSWTRWPIALCFLLLWLLVGTFNITNTIAGQYNMHSQNQQAYSSSQQNNNPARIEWQGLQDRKSEISTRIKEKRDQLASLQGLYSSMGTLEERTKNNRTWSDTSRQIKDAERILDKLSLENEAIRSKEKDFISVHPEIIDSSGKVKDAPDFYGWLARVLKKDREMIQFILSLIPAVFCDLVSPFSIAIFLFLNKQQF